MNKQTNVIFNVKYVIKINFIRINSKLESRQKDKVEACKSEKNTHSKMFGEVGKREKYVRLTHFMHNFIDQKYSNT